MGVLCLRGGDGDGGGGGMTLGSGFWPRCCSAQRSKTGDTVLFHSDLAEASPAEGPSVNWQPLVRRTETFSPSLNKKSSSIHNVRHS